MSATVTEVVDVAARGFGASTARTYQPYWRLLVARHGDTPISDISVGDLELVLADAIARAQRRRPDTAARAPKETCVTALRALFSRAHAAGLTAANPAAALLKPRRARSRRRALDAEEFAQLVDAVRTTSRDPDLDLLLVRFHVETGARRQGALNLRVADIDLRRATVWLREKDDSEREQPVSPSLIGLLQAHADARGGKGRVFRASDGAPISARRYDTLFTRARAALPWTDRVPVSAHVLRHTAITAVARLGGYPVAQAFAGHTPPSVTGRYIHATVAEIAAVIAQLTGEPHPLAPRHGPRPDDATVRENRGDGDPREAEHGRFHPGGPPARQPPMMSTGSTTLPRAPTPLRTFWDTGEQLASRPDRRIGRVRCGKCPTRRPLANSCRARDAGQQS